MTVTEIVPAGKGKSKVVLDEGLTLVLYAKEVKRFEIQEEEALSSETYQKILTEVLFKRARERALFLLKSSDKTEQEIRRKLKEGEYPLGAVDYAVDFLKEYRFINDLDYGRRYVQCRSGNRSERQIRYELQKKGLDREAVQEILKECPVDEEAGIRAYIRKKHLKPEELDREERRKLAAALGRKGFSYEEVYRVMGGDDFER